MTTPTPERIVLTDDMPGIPPLVHHARIAADVLFVDPPPVYAVRVSEYDVVVQGYERDGMPAWAEKHNLVETDDTRPDWRRWVGVIEGVTFEAVCSS